MLFSYFSIFLCLIIIPFSLANNNKIFSNFLFLILLIFIFFTIGLNSQNQDYKAYVDIFSDPYGYSEIGYVYLIEVLKILGFETHRSVLFVLASLIVYTLLRIYRYTFYFGYFLIFYIIFLFPLDVIQIRNTFAVFIFLNSVLFLYEKRYLYFFIALIISVLFHSFAFSFVLLLLISLFLRGKKRYYKVFLLLILFLFLMQFASILNIRNLNVYFSDGKLSSVIIWGFIVITFLIMAHYLILNKKTLEKIADKKLLDLTYLLYLIILASVVLTPALYIFYEFNRLYRLVFLLMIIFVSALFKYMKLSVKLIFVFYFLVVFSLFGLYYSSELNYDWILFGL